jgi:hypothetical protein
MNAIALKVETLRQAYAGISSIDPATPEYKQLIALLDRQSTDTLKVIAGAKIKFVSGLAANRVFRREYDSGVALDKLSIRG